jgi:putative hemolysin
MFTVDELLSTHSSKPVPRWYKPFLRYLLCEKEFQRFGEKYPNLHGLDFIEQALRYLSFACDVCENELEHIPAQGPVVIVANHPIGSLDGLALLQIISRVRGDVKIIANQLLSQIKPLNELLLPVDNMNGNTQRQQITAINEHLGKGGALIVFPAGEVSRLNIHGIYDGRWNNGFLRLATQHRAPIVPIYISGRNSWLFYGTSLLNKSLSTLLLVREMFQQRKGHIKIRIGAKIPFNEWSKLPVTGKALAKLFRKHLYRLGKSKSGILTTEAPIALAENRVKLKKAVEACQPLGNTPDGKHIYLYRREQAPSSVILKELGRLREIAFRAVGEGTGLRRDLDSFDDDYYHLLLWDNKELEIVGAYRFMPTKEQLERKGHKGLYSYGLFHYDTAMAHILDQGIELGRSFIQPRYWGKRSLDYLWQGIGAFLAQNPQYRYLMGPVSMSASLPAPARDLLVAFYKLHFSPRWPLARSRQPYANGSLDIAGQFIGQDYQQDLSILKSMLDNLGCGIPTLYKQYSELCEPGGVQFLDFGIDPDFANCVDGLVLIDIHKMKLNKRQRYIDCHLTDPRDVVTTASA